MHGGGVIFEFVKCYVGFCTQGALKWIRKKKKRAYLTHICHLEVCMAFARRSSYDSIELRSSPQEEH